MREYINLIKKLNEASSMGASEITKYDWRFNKFIEKIKSRSPFTTVDDREVIIDPREAARFTEMFKNNLFKGNIKTRLTDGEELPLSKLAKTTEFGGAAAAAGQSPSEVGKEGLLVKPSQIGITDKNIPATDLYEVLKSNPILNSTDYGKVIISLADYIVSGEYVMLPEEYQGKDKEKVRKAIVDYAGEYLGVLALLYDRTRFPKKAEFSNWLGGDIGDLTLNFPSQSNNNIADSYAMITNKNTNHTLNISSKGTGGGAAPAISGLKVPEGLKRLPKFKNAIQFIELCQKTGTIQQAFDALDLIYKVNPDSVNKKWAPYLPFSSASPDIVEKAKISLSAKKQRGTIPLPKHYQKLVSDVGGKEGSTEGGKLIYAVKKEVIHAMNVNDAIPEFKSVVLQILEMNFLQQYTDYKGGELTFATQWPAKLDGAISVETKSTVQEPTAGGFSFKLGRTDSDVSSEPGEDRIDGDTEEADSGSFTEPEFAKAAAQVVSPVRKSAEKGMRMKRK